MTPSVAPSVTDAVAKLAVLDLTMLGCASEVEDHVRAAAQVKAWAEAWLTRLSARADQLAAEVGGGAGGEHTLRSATRMSGREAATVSRRSLVERHLPTFVDALSAGEVSAEHCDVMARLIPTIDPAKLGELPLHEGELLGYATRVTPGAFARAVRDLVAAFDPGQVGTELEHLERQAELKLWRGKDGAHRCAGTFGPTTGATAVRALVQELARLAKAEEAKPVARRRTTEQLRMAALTNLLTGARAPAAGQPQPQPRATLAVHVRLERLLAASDDPALGVCETSAGIRLPIELVRELALDAEIVPVLLDQAGMARELSKTAQSRLASFVQRVLLRAMHPTCVMPGCDVPFDDCEVHHFSPFDGSNTVLRNLGPVCDPDHDRLHARGWQVSLDRRRTVTVRLRDGTIWATRPFEPPGAGPPEAAA